MVRPYRKHGMTRGGSREARAAYMREYRKQHPAYETGGPKRQPLDRSFPVRTPAEIGISAYQRQTMRARRWIERQERARAAVEIARAACAEEERKMDAGEAHDYAAALRTFNDRLRAYESLRLPHLAREPK